MRGSLSRLDGNDGRKDGFEGDGGFPGVDIVLGKRVRGAPVRGVVRNVLGCPRLTRS